MRLLGKHVEAGAGDGSVSQSRNQRLLVDDRAARDVDDVPVAATETDLDAALQQR